MASQQRSLPVQLACSSSTNPAPQPSRLQPQSGAFPIQASSLGLAQWVTAPFQQRAPCRQTPSPAFASCPSSHTSHPLYAHLDLSRPLCLQEPSAFAPGSSGIGVCADSPFQQLSRHQQQQPTGFAGAQNNGYGFRTDSPFQQRLSHQQQPTGFVDVWNNETRLRTDSPFQQQLPQHHQQIQGAFTPQGSGFDHHTDFALLPNTAQQHRQQQAPYQPQVVAFQLQQPAHQLQQPAYQLQEAAYQLQQPAQQPPQAAFQLQQAAHQSGLYVSHYHRQQQPGAEGDAAGKALMHVPLLQATAGNDTAHAAASPALAVPETPLAKSTLHASMASATVLHFVRILSRVLLPSLI